MTRAQLEKIIGRANRGGRVEGAPSTIDVVYAKKTTGRVVRRRVRPYELSGGTLWGTDTIHGKTQIHNFLTRRVLSARVSKPSHTFRPQWDVQTPGVSKKKRAPKKR